MHQAIELAALAVAASAACVAAGGLLWAGCALGWTLLALGWIDWDHFFLPDLLTLPLIVAGLAVTWAIVPWALADHALAAALGYASLRLLGLLYRGLRGFDGVGEGDAKLLAASGAWLGLAALPGVLLGAAAIALAAAGVLRLRGRAVGRTTPLPFGAALAAATWLLWLGAAG
jgi:leader peptidase (prepilin peptidase)/N-methyltransferase